MHNHSSSQQEPKESTVEDFPPYTRSFKDTYRAELHYIKKRRSHMGLSVEEINDGYAPSSKCSPSTQTHLVGLAFSGGGIRSAIFNLGLLQTLAKRKALHYCDYLSTVSGGGYIGSCLSSLLANNPEASTTKDQFPLREEYEGELEERKEISYLRATKNYLGLSRGIFNLDNWHVVGMLLSGLFLMNAFPLALMISFTLLLYVIEESFYFFGLEDIFYWWFGINHVKQPDLLGIQTLVYLIAIIAALKIGWIRWRKVLPFVSTSYERRQQHDRRIAHWTWVATGLVVGAFLFDFIYSEAWRWSSSEDAQDQFFSPVLFFVSISSLILIIGGQLKLYGSQMRQQGLEIIMSMALMILLITLPIGFLSIVYKAEYFSHLIQLSVLTQEHPEHERILKEFREIYIQQEGYIDKVLEAFAPQLKNIDHSDHITHHLKEHYTKTKTFILTTLSSIILILLFIGVLTNINYASQHYFYRDRLSHTFLIRRMNDKVEVYPRLLLKDLHQHHNGPYHLINTTLNIPHSDLQDNPYSKGRGADFFLFSKYYCGSESTGYRRTDTYKRGLSKLATAMAISGAAVSPEMGTLSTNPFIAFMMTLLNMRLNLWMLNPCIDRPPKFIFWPAYLLRELLRKGNEHDALLNLSDGGHLENLAVYPLLRRRCRLIIASDVSADPHLQLESLANLQRKARIDLGIEIQLTNLSRLRANSEEPNQTHFILGTIHYPHHETGILLYIKASLIGEEPEDILAYQREDFSFPHQTTADQFFDEQQFESYRRLGEFIGEKIFPVEVIEKTEVKQFIEYVSKLGEHSVCQG